MAPVVLAGVDLLSVVDLVDCVLLCFWKLRLCELLSDAPHGHLVFLPEWT